MVHANMPTKIVVLKPNFLKKYGNKSMNKTSEIWPIVIFPVAFSTPISDKNGLAFW